jgi:hypothetical protein
MAEKLELQDPFGLCQFNSSTAAELVLYAKQYVDRPEPLFQPDSSSRSGRLEQARSEATSRVRDWGPKLRIILAYRSRLRAPPRSAYVACMRIAWLIPLLLICWPLACSDDDQGDGNAAGSAGSGGGAGSGAGGAGGTAGSGAGGGAAGSSMAGSSGSGGSGGGSTAAGGTAGTGGAGGGSSASGADGCIDLCIRPLVCPGCLQECDDAVALCPSQSEALFACEAGRPNSDFQCLGQLVVPNDDVCVSETAAFERCRIGF